jgi:hypothetical protein
MSVYSIQEATRFTSPLISFQKSSTAVPNQPKPSLSQLDTNKRNFHIFSGLVIDANLKYQILGVLWNRNL